MADLTLSSEQADIYAVLEGTLQHVFVTGRAGTGKSTLLQHFVANTDKKVAVVAPTGVAALLVGGQTIHSFFRLPIGIIADQKIWQPEEVRKLLRGLDTLVIDEISMVNADMLDAINRSLKQARRNIQPFGGVQLVMFGDPYQLAPVPSRHPDERAWFADNYESQWFFHAKVWQDTELYNFELTEIHRQSDDEFKTLLNAVRHGIVTAEQAAVLNNAGAREVPADRPITLAARNDTVNRINQQQLAQLPGKLSTKVADINGNFGNALPADEKLELKEGAQVMFLRNDVDFRWVNGTVGTVLGIRGDTVKVEVDGTAFEVYPAIWDQVRYRYNSVDKSLEREVVGEFMQFPLRLAWAVTIHKSQGQSYDSAVIDLGSGAFSPGQTYVALSRIRSLDGLYLSRPLRPSDVIVDPHVREFMAKKLQPTTKK